MLCRCSAALANFEFADPVVIVGVFQGLLAFFFFFLANFLYSFVDRMYAHVQFQRCFPSFERGSLPAVWDCGTRRVCVVIGFGPSKLIGSGYRYDISIGGIITHSENVLYPPQIGLNDSSTHT